MPPKNAAPASKTAKPASRAKPASAKPMSKASKPASKPADLTSTAPVSRRGRAGASDIVAPKPILESEGDLKMAVPSKSNGKRSRVSELVKESKKPRRSSLGRPSIELPIPQPPSPSDPHTALFVFGTGESGQLGQGPDALDDIKRPKLHAWFEEQIEDGKLSRNPNASSGGLEAVAAGGMHTLAIDEGGRIRSWGINDNACLGRITSDVPDPENPGKFIDNEVLETVPTVIESLEREGFRAVSVAAGDSVSVAVSDKGEIRAWGSFRGNEGVLGFDGVPGHSPFQFTPISLASLQKVKVIEVACGDNHVLALTTTGHVFVWGSGEQNQLGRRIMARRQLNGLEPERLGLRNIVHVAAGVYHSFAVDASGAVWAWGLNTFHQTGLDTDQDMVIVPAQVEALAPQNHDGAKVIQISGGDHHSLFLFDNGEVWACGRSDAFQLGIPEDHPAFEGIKERREVVKQEKLAKVEAAKKRLAMMLTKGPVDDADKAEAEHEIQGAEISVNTPQDDYVAEPVRIAFPPVPESYEVVPDFPSWAESKPNDNPIAHISAGTRHNLAISRSGHVYSWGLGMMCQLGLGDEEEAKVPTLVRSKSLKPYRAVAASAGGQHCCVLAKLRD